MDRNEIVSLKLEVFRGLSPTPSVASSGDFLTPSRVFNTDYVSSALRLQVGLQVRIGTIWWLLVVLLISG